MIKSISSGMIVVILAMLFSYGMNLLLVDPEMKKETTSRVRFLSRL